MRLVFDVGLRSRHAGAMHRAPTPLATANPDPPHPAHPRFSAVRPQG